MELSILDALSASKPPEPQESDHLPQDKRLNNGLTYITDGYFKMKLETYGCSKTVISDCFDYDVVDRDWLLPYYEKRFNDGLKSPY